MDTLGTNCYYSNVLFYGAEAKTCPIVSPTPSFVTPVILQRTRPHAFHHPIPQKPEPQHCNGYEIDIHCDKVYTHENPSGTLIQNM